MSNMSTNRPFLANFLAAFRAQSTYKASTAGSPSGPSSSLSATQIAQGARAIATKAGAGSNTTSSADQASSSTTAAVQAASNHHYHHHPSAAAASSHARPHSHPRPSLNQAPASTESPASSISTPLAPSSPPTPSSSNPIPIADGHDRQRRGSDSSSGSGGFRDALGPEKWYIGGRSAGGEERFYRLGMVTKGGGRLGGSGRVGSIDQLSL
ncbi:hypothetical protein CDV55_108369 [Aspergillus turcosus]|uniref:Uncharacterized protein n=1 Tax=Aspergillus turcosus TaxID=1245748 RepID=A0A229Z2Y4_9EURO|nr:hypothetical protein CDV55_108369 [Aspergillus turcosus]RLL93389.1 hypothetical protein CFD26_100116 [Aspergillus turcosus]